MRVATYVLLASLFLTLQSAVAPWVEMGGVRPDWLLVAVVFLGLYAEPKEAVIGSWVLGLCSDLLTLERPGLISLSYMLAAAAAVSVREYVFRYWTLTQLSLTLVLALAVQSAWTIFRRTAFEPTSSFWSDWLTGAFLTSLYTAAWAPLLHKGLLLLSEPLGLPRPRYTHAGLRSMRGSNV